MATLIQSLAWALIYAPVQGLLVYMALQLVLKLTPGASSNARYHFALSALMTLLLWFTGTWLQQYRELANHASWYSTTNAVAVQQPSPMDGQIIVSVYKTSISLVQQLAPWLSAFYITGLLLMLVRLSGGLSALFSLRKTGITQADNHVWQMLGSLKTKLHIDKKLQLFISAKARVPMVVGFLKPAILIPAAAMAQLSTTQLESILMHELAHIKRHDYLINILQTIAETIMFFNPFAWMISGIIRREREHCCDDIVLLHTGTPITYATALATLAEHTEKTSSLTIAASGPAHHLFNRIKRIMEMKKTPFSYSKAAAALLIIAGITCSVLWLTPAFAKPKEFVTKTTANKPNGEEDLLIKRLTEDGLIDANKGYLVEKKQDKLFIDGRRQTDETAAKYLSEMKRPNLSIRVYPYRYWQPKSITERFLPPSMFPEIGDTTRPGC